ncbi:hypothetical protein NDU88_001775 [Pleurodeles waltl]|uniref:Uncharacterized protein n=1 Tax=Pleurodeles waltl TaxID=8319 RepID=A0AAV7P8Y6_PLEWA|nr:hypothetical protein NDU88_001775 [Pleurodeles waltl]
MERGGPRLQTGGSQCTAHSITTYQSAIFSGAVAPPIKTQLKQPFRSENAHLHTPHEELGQHGSRTPHTPSDSLPAPLPGARTPAQKTTGAWCPECLVQPCPTQMRASPYRSWASGACDGVPSAAVLETAVPRVAVLEMKGPV